MPETLVIADATGPVGLAGVMGGEKSGIAADTADVFLEGAYFPPDTVAGVARRHGLVTDAAQRFERGVDPRGQERAIERATELLVEIAGGRPGPAVLTQDEAALPKRPGVTLRPERVASLLGVQIPRAEIEEILRRLGMQVAGAGDVLGVIPPSHRFDIAIEQDLIEEVGRIHGYDNIPRSDARMPQRPQPSTERAVTRERLRLLLVDRGYQEVITYSFVDPRLQRLMFPRQEALALENPLSAELGEMRVSLWPGLVETLRFNQRRQQERVRIFEVGTRFEMSGGRLVESQGIAGLVTGAALPEQWGAENRAADFYDIKSDVEGLFALTGRQRCNKLCRDGARCACIRVAARRSSTARLASAGSASCSRSWRASSNCATRRGSSRLGLTRASGRKCLYSGRFRSFPPSGATWRSWSTKR